MLSRSIEKLQLTRKSIEMWSQTPPRLRRAIVIRYDVECVLSNLTVGLQTSNRIAYGRRGSNTLRVFATENVNNSSTPQANILK